jgi:hypothetical protein
MIPLGTKAFERILDFRRNKETGQDELLIKYKVRLLEIIKPKMLTKKNEYLEYEFPSC